jgi:hypothetical protein
MNVEEKIEVPNLEEDERKQKRIELQRRIDQEVDMESKDNLLK